jgi:hypothetical protein
MLTCTSHQVDMASRGRAGPPLLHSGDARQMVLRGLQTDSTLETATGFPRPQPRAAHSQIAVSSLSSLRHYCCPRQARVCSRDVSRASHDTVYPCRFSCGVFQCRAVYMNYHIFTYKNIILNIYIGLRAPLYGYRVQYGTAFHFTRRTHTTTDHQHHGPR